MCVLHVACIVTLNAFIRAPLPLYWVLLADPLIPTVQATVISTVTATHPV